MIDSREQHIYGSQVAPGMTLIRACDRGLSILGLPHQRCPDGMHWLYVLRVREGAGINIHLQVSGPGFVDEVVVRANQTVLVQLPWDWAPAAEGAL